MGARRAEQLFLKKSNLLWLQPWLSPGAGAPSINRLFPLCHACYHLLTL